MKIYTGKLVQDRFISSMTDLLSGANSIAFDFSGLFIICDEEDQILLVKTDKNFLGHDIAANVVVTVDIIQCIQLLC